MKNVQPMDVKANGHYMPGVLAGGMLYISGQLPIDPLTGTVVTGDILRTYDGGGLCRIRTVLRGAWQAG